jgi:endonuclease G, mitochondrial
MPTPQEALETQQQAAAARFTDRAAQRADNVTALGRDGGFAQVNSPERLARRLDRLTRYYTGERLPTAPQQVPSAAPADMIDAALERVSAVPDRREAPSRAEEPSPGVASPAAKLAAAVDVALETMDGAGVEKEDVSVAAARERAGIVLEKIIGSTDFLDIRYLEGGVAAARAVCRIDIRDDLGRVAGYGTGSLVSPRLLLTNHHVLPDAEVARRSSAEFNYQDGLDGRPLQAVLFGLDPGAFFVADEERDFALVAVAAGEQALSPFGLNPLIEAEGKALVGEFVTIVQHPAGRKKQVSLRENRIVDWLEFFLHYETDTEPGSSGSPVFNDQWEIVALHHASVVERQRPEFGGYLNEGIRTSRILELVHAQALSGEQRALAEQLTRRERISVPVPLATSSPATAKAAAPSPEAGTGDEGASSREVRVIVPLEITVRLGRPSSTALGAAPGATLAPEG